MSENNENNSNETYEEQLAHALSPGFCEQLIESYLDSYFAKIKGAVIFEESFLADNDMSYNHRIDYFKLKRFSTTAMNNLYDLDEQLFRGPLQKLRIDVFEQFEYYSKFALLNTKTIFENEFLNKIPAYVTNKQKLEKHINQKAVFAREIKNIEEYFEKIGDIKKLKDDGIKEYKALRVRYGDQLHYLSIEAKGAEEASNALDAIRKAYFPIFKKLFETTHQELLQRLKKTINTKSYYLDNLTWAKASESKKVAQFFVSAGITDRFDTGMFIRYYLKNINVAQSKDSDWHGYLKEILKVYG